MRIFAVDISHIPQKDIFFMHFRDLSEIEIDHRGCQTHKMTSRVMEASAVRAILCSGISMEVCCTRVLPSWCGSLVSVQRMNRRTLIVNRQISVISARAWFFKKLRIVIVYHILFRNQYMQRIVPICVDEKSMTGKTERKNRRETTKIEK